MKGGASTALLLVGGQLSIVCRVQPLQHVCSSKSHNNSVMAVVPRGLHSPAGKLEDLNHSWQEQRKHDAIQQLGPCRRLPVTPPMS